MEPRIELKIYDQQSDWKTEKKWEDDINDFFKQVLHEKENENPIERSNQTNNNWINIAKVWRRWALSEGNYTTTV